MLAGGVLDPLCVLGRLSKAMRANHSQLYGEAPFSGRLEVLAPLTHSRLIGWEQSIGNMSSIQIRSHSSNWGPLSIWLPVSAECVSRPPHLPIPITASV